MHRPSTGNELQSPRITTGRNIYKDREGRSLFLTTNKKTIESFAVIKNAVFTAGTSGLKERAELHSSTV